MSRSHGNKRDDDSQKDLGGSLGLSRWTLPVGVMFCLFAIVQGAIVSPNGSEVFRIWVPTFVGGCLGIHGAISLSAHKRNVIADGPSVFAGVTAAILMLGGTSLVNIAILFIRAYQF